MNQTITHHLFSLQTVFVIYIFTKVKYNATFSSFQDRAACWVLVAHTYNSSYSGSRDQSVQSQPRQIVLKTLSPKNPSEKGLVEWLKV
jgi:hypothetical protein